jgi:hypothetical protein
LVYRSDDGPKNGLKLVTFVINCVVTTLDTFIELRTTEISGQTAVQLVEALFYKLEGHGFDS